MAQHSNPLCTAVRCGQDGGDPVAKSVMKRIVCFHEVGLYQNGVAEVGCLCRRIEAGAGSRPCASSDAQHLPVSELPK